MTTVTTDTRTPLWAMTDEQLVFVASDDTAEWDRRCVAASVLGERTEVPVNLDLSLFHEGWKAGVVYAYLPSTYAPVFDDHWFDGFVRGKAAVADHPEDFPPVELVRQAQARQQRRAAQAPSWAPVP